MEKLEEVEERKEKKAKPLQRDAAHTSFSLSRSHLQSEASLSRALLLAGER
jgi:hypothetical protein